MDGKFMTHRKFLVAGYPFRIAEIKHPLYKVFFVGPRIKKCEGN